MKTGTPSRWLRWLLVAPGLLACTLAHALIASDICTRNPKGRITTTIQVNVGRDAEVGDVIGPWTTVGPFTWTCVRKVHKDGIPIPNDRYAARSTLRPDKAGAKDGSIIAVDGQTYRVYHLKDGKREIGYIARVQRKIIGVPGDEEFSPLTVGIEQDDVRELVGGGPRKKGESFQVKITLQIRLVKVQDPMAARDNYYNGRMFMEMFFHTVKYKVGGHKEWERWESEGLDKFKILQVHIQSTTAACETPKMDVDLGTARSNHLVRDGAGPTTAFALKFQQCPPGMVQIGYRFDAIPKQAIENGTLPMDTHATASGVGVQVLRADDTPLPFTDTFMPLTDYDPFATGLRSYALPLKARIVRTTGDLQGGDVHASMNMVVRYQ